MADIDRFVDCTYGDDTTGDGSKRYPYKTIKKAYEYPSCTRIILRKGFYQEPAMSYLGLDKPIIGYDEDVTIDGSLNVTNIDRFVDCTYGDDTTGDGSKRYPYKTIKKAYEYPSCTRIILRKGFYQEPAMSYLGLDKSIIGYDEDVTIDGSLNVTNSLFNSIESGVLLRNVKLTNYKKSFAGSFGYLSNIRLDNCFLKPYTKSETIIFPSFASITLTASGCTFVGHEFTGFSGIPAKTTMNNCIIEGIDGIQDFIDISENLTYITNSAFPGATEDERCNININNHGATCPGFANISGGNYALASDSYLRGKGQDGANIGATFQPAFRVGLYSDNLFNSFAETEWENDPLWWDPTLYGGIGGLGDDALNESPQIQSLVGPAVYIGGYWQINGSYPNAKISRIRSKVYHFDGQEFDEQNQPIPIAKLARNIGWSAKEDLVSDPNIVIDNSLTNDDPTPTREIEWRYDADNVNAFLKGDLTPSWTIGHGMVGKNTDLQFVKVKYFQFRMTINAAGPQQ